MEIKICAWSDKDLASMLKLWNQIVEQGEAFPQEERLNEQNARDFFQSQSFCGVAKNLPDEEICGLYILHPNNVGRCGHICNASYAVDKNYRGNGVGEHLIRHSLEKAKNLGFRIMQFNAVVEDNHSAKRLYEKIGFKKLGIIPGGFKDITNTYKAIGLYYYDLTSGS